MSLTQEQYRVSLLLKIRNSYRQLRAIAAMLLSPRLQRKYVNSKCKAALKLEAERESLKADHEKEFQALWEAWASLPEVHCGPNDQYRNLRAEAMKFAEKLSKRKPIRQKYLKTQRKLVEDV